ncbi:hypothetical protein B0H13DRAFT_2294424 [Mycena leptocephala]|nr:hypothetical protein B0H13DRAFT_2294424 [Mycena leptocephala]
MAVGANPGRKAHSYPPPPPISRRHAPTSNAYKLTAHGQHAARIYLPGESSFCFQGSNIIQIKCQRSSGSTTLQDCVALLSTRSQFAHLLAEPAYVEGAARRETVCARQLPGNHWVTLAQLRKAVIIECRLHRNVKDVCFLPLDASLKLIQRIPKESKGKAGPERSDEGMGEIFVAGCIGNECERFPDLTRKQRYWLESNMSEIPEAHRIPNLIMPVTKFSDQTDIVAPKTGQTSK